jgi:hypothetical protein
MSNFMKIRPFGADFLPLRSDGQRDKYEETDSRFR